ncbi:MAG: F0F1 ATP synthase subunit B [Candidatus Eiseniibacteriota bacterium]
MGNLIDFKQVITQIVGFLIFLWLIRKYAWGPLLSTLEARQQKIAADLLDAETTKREAGELKVELETKLRGIEQQARTRIQEAVAEGQEVAAQIRADAQQQARARVERAQAEIESEKAKAQKALHEDLSRMAVLGAEKILRKKLDEAEQRRLIAEFIGEVKEVR